MQYSSSTHNRDHITAVNCNVSSYQWKQNSQPHLEEEAGRRKGEKETLFADSERERKKKEKRKKEKPMKETLPFKEQSCNVSSYQSKQWKNSLNS